MKNCLFNTITALALLLSLGIQPVFANERPQVEILKDARDTARLAQERNLPILIMFGTDECPYCELLKEEFLIPMLISGDYNDKILIREAHVSEGESIIDFSGKEVSMDDFISRYRVYLFPTMVFVDSKGEQLVERIRGITTPSLFGGELDGQIDKALIYTRKRFP